jgi:hypothetical protein
MASVPCRRLLNLTTGKIWTIIDKYIQLFSLHGMPI